VISVTAARSAWATGTVIEQWNGTAWKQVRAPAGEFRSVAAISARDAWAAGYSGVNQALILRWNGTSWK
jgi:hypothetical protein